jgi:hypothetical protein
MWVKEQRVHTPRVRLDTTVHVFVLRDVGEVTIMFCLYVLDVFGMLCLHITHPKSADNG